jgi:hypothetical protein
MMGFFFQIVEGDGALQHQPTVGNRAFITSSSSMTLGGAESADTAKEDTASLESHCGADGTKNSLGFGER